MNEIQKLIHGTGIRYLFLVVQSTPCSIAFILVKTSTIVQTHGNKSSALPIKSCLRVRARFFHPQYLPSLDSHLHTRLSAYPENSGRTLHVSPRHHQSPYPTTSLSLPKIYAHEVSQSSLQSQNHPQSPAQHEHPQVHSGIS